jgi:hypothetical protein
MQNSLDRLRQNLLVSYIHVSIGIGIIAFLFPVAVYLNGLFFGISLQDTLSNYFFAKAGGGIDPFDHPARVLFVGGLFAIGTFMFLYKGFTRGENIILNLAGVFAIGVAVFPMTMFKFYGCTPHAICAIAMFLCIIYLAIWGKRNSLDLMDDPQRKAFYEKWYNIIAGLMLSFIVVTAGLHFLFHPGKSFVFWVESVGIWVFAAYWLLKGMELNDLVNQLRKSGKLRPDTFEIAGSPQTHGV